MAKTNKILSLSSKVNKVFIIPNNLGLYYIGLWTTSFLLSVGYSSNLLLLMAIVQLTLFFWWMVTAHADTKVITVKKVEVNASFAKKQTSFFIYWNDCVISQNIKSVTLLSDNNMSIKTQLENNHFKFQIEKRGIIKIKKLCLELQTGFWLFKTWKYLPYDIEIVTFPEPIMPNHNILRPIEKKSEIDVVKLSHNLTHELDLQKDVTNNTRPNRINWKRYAAQGKLVERYGEIGSHFEESFDLDIVQNENDLSYMTYAILQCFYNNQRWTIKHQDKIHGPFNTNGNNNEELSTCLKILATYQL